MERGDSQTRRRQHGHRFDDARGSDCRKQDKCPWNEAEGTTEHRCAVKGVSICPHFCGIEYMDFVLCCYPNDNPLRCKAG